MISTTSDLARAVPSQALGCALVAAALLAASPVAARLPIPEVLDADDPSISEDLGLGDFDLTGLVDIDEDVVLAAQKIQTTIQDAPSIITVITRQQIAERGYRTINDVLQTVAGFEGDRWEGNGWHKEAFARGLPRTVLVLINGVNVIEPLRNFINLDRKIPLEIVERVEVTSGPGGVLWGSNALLGIVNIVTRGPDDKGVHALVGFGDGRGDQLHFKVGAGVSKRFTEDIGLYTHISLFSTNGPEMLIDQEKVIGALTEPSPDGPTFYLPQSRRASAGKRSWFLNFAGRLELGPVSIDWMLPFEEEYRVQSTGGSNMSANYLDPDESGTPTRGQDSLRLVSATYKDRFVDGTLGLTARGYFTQWAVREDPFGAFAPSGILLARFGHAKDLHVRMAADLVMRTGVAVDLDWQPVDGVSLLVGGEALYERLDGLDQRSWVRDSAGACPDGYTYDADDAYLKCHVDDVLVENTDRVIGATFAQLELRPVPTLAITAGLRLQASDTYDPALLFSGGLVWNVFDRTNLKLFFASGLRPPSFTATHVRDTSSGISFLANPDLQVETSRSIEAEINTMLLRDVGPVRDLFLRTNAAFTVMDNVIRRPAGGFENAGERHITSAEGMVRLRFNAGHELWGNYTWTEVRDDAASGGRIRNFAEHMGSVGGKLTFLDDHIELNAMLTVKGEMTDPNRPAVFDDPTGQYGATCAQLMAGAFDADDPRLQMQQVCQLTGMGGGVWVNPGTRVDETIRPVALLDVGIRFKNIWRDLTAAVHVYNTFDNSYYEPDFFEDPRVMSRPQPKPGISVYGQVSIGL